MIYEWGYALSARQLLLYMLVKLTPLKSKRQYNARMHYFNSDTTTYTYTNVCVFHMLCALRKQDLLHGSHKDRAIHAYYILRVLDQKTSK